MYLQRKYKNLQFGNIYKWYMFDFYYMYAVK